MKILVMWTHLSGYLISNLNSASEAGHEVHLLHLGDHDQTPYGESLQYSNICAINVESFSHTNVRKYIIECNPDLVLVAGWHIKKYRKALFFCPYLVVFFMDNQWKDTLKQKIAISIRFWLIKPRYDFAFLPGLRQQEYALKLGFPQEKIWLRALNGDERLLNNYVSEGNIAAFLYVGRLSSEKGIVQLLDAYKEYFSSETNPWKLHVVGDGPLRNLIEGTEGIHWHGFLNPKESALVFQLPSVFVMPSLRDAWGVAMHEAALTGHPIIATRACGASDAFVRDNLNGFLFNVGDHNSLVELLKKVTHLDQIVLNDFSKVSRQLAQSYSSDIWVNSLVQIHDSPQAQECRIYKQRSLLVKVMMVIFWK